MVIWNPSKIQVAQFKIKIETSHSNASKGFKNPSKSIKMRLQASNQDVLLFRIYQSSNEFLPFILVYPYFIYSSDIYLAELEIVPSSNGF